MIKKCKGCFTQFKGRKNKVYCTTACRKSKDFIPEKIQCITCQKIMIQKWKNQKYCSQSCAAITNNHITPKRIKFTKQKCLDCKTDIKSNKTVRCRSCYFKHLKQKNIIKIDSWLKGEWRGGTDSSLSNIVRIYLLEESGYKCSICGFNENHPDDGKTILEINHIDGNGLNHSPNNLEVLCPNHHALTSSYRGRNYGSGRPISYIRKIII